MRNFNFRFFLSALALYSIMMAATPSAVRAAPVRFNQVVQVINAKPGKANTGGFAQLRLAGDDPLVLKGDEPKTDVPTTPQQDDPRVITETRSEIVEEEVCDCAQPTTSRRRISVLRAWFSRRSVAVPDSARRR